MSRKASRGALWVRRVRWVRQARRTRRTWRARLAPLWLRALAAFVALAPMGCSRHGLDPRDLRWEIPAAEAPGGTLLPAGIPVNFGGAMRHARVLRAGTPRVLEGRAPVRGDLLLAVGCGARDAAAGRIRIHARGPRVEITRTIDLAVPGSRGSWTSVRFPGLGMPGGEVRLEVLLESGPGASDSTAGDRDIAPGTRDIAAGARDPAPGASDTAWIETPLRWIPADPEGLPPRVLLVTVDTLRADAVSRAADETIPAVALPWIAAHGAYAPRAVAAGSNTSSSHASILTSLDPKDHGAFDNRGLARVTQATLADRLRERGYLTAAAVTVGLLSPVRFPPARGFDSVFMPFHDVKRSAADLLEDLLPWLRERAGLPFFLWLHLFEPHQPYGPEARARLEEVPDFREQLPAIREEIRRHGLPKRFAGGSVDAAAEHLREKMRLYHGEVLEADARIAQVLGVLDETGVLGQTFVIVTGDHGESLWEGGLYGFHKGASEAVARVPLLAAGPGIPPGLRLDAPVRHVDLAPTILGLLGMGPGPGAVVRGIDRSLEFQGKSSPPPPPAFYQFREDAVACYQDGWKAVYERGARGGTSSLRLFRIDEDPFERRDRADQEPDRVARMRHRIERWLETRLEAKDAETAAPIDPEREEMLRQLGYE